MQIMILISEALIAALKNEASTVILRSKVLIVILSEQSERENLFSNKKYGKHITTTKNRIPDPRNQRTEGNAGQRSGEALWSNYRKFK